MSTKHHKKKKKKKPAARESSLDEKTASYYKRVSDTIECGFEDTEDKEIFVSNVFETLEDEAFTVSQDPIASFVVEKLISMAKNDLIFNLMNKLEPHWLEMCSNKFASYVLQSIIEKVYNMIYPMGTSQSDEAQESFLKFSRQLLSRIDIFVQDSYASHIVRITLEVLSGVRVKEDIIRSRYSKTQRQDVKENSLEKEVVVSEISEDFSKMLDEFKSKITDEEKLKEYIYHRLANPVIQTYLLVVHQRKPKQCVKFCKNLLNKLKIFDSKTEISIGEDKSAFIPDILTENIGSYLAEQVISVATPEIFAEIFETHFKSNILVIALHPIGNFMLHKLLSKVNEEQFGKIYDELHGHLEDILANNHIGIITQLLSTANRLGSKQDKLLKALMKSFHCHKPEERQTKCVQLFSSLTAYESFYSSPADDETKDDNEVKAAQPPLLTTINLHGSLMLQELLKFGNPRLIVNSMLDMKPVEIRNTSCDPCGSRIIDMFFKSGSVGEKSRTIVINKLKGWFSDLACHKNGSRSLESMWSAGTLSNKETILQDMIKHEAKVKDNLYGKFIYKNFGMFNFVNRLNDWKQQQLGNIKKRKAFMDLLSDDQGAKKKVKVHDDSEEEQIIDADDDERDISDKGQAKGKTKKKKRKDKLKNNK